MASSSSSISFAASGSSVSAARTTKSSSLFNFSSQNVSIKLDRDNYLFWESVVRLFIKGNRLLSHIDGLTAPPPRVLPDGDKTIPTQHMMIGKMLIPCLWSNLTWVEVTSELLAFESRIDQLNQFSSLSIQPSTNVAQRDESKNSGSGQNTSGSPWRGGSPQGRPRGRGRGPRDGARCRGFNGNRPYCTLCERQGHAVHNCYYRFDRNFQPPTHGRNLDGSSNAFSQSPQAFYAVPLILREKSRDSVSDLSSSRVEMENIVDEEDGATDTFLPNDAQTRGESPLNLSKSRDSLTLSHASSSSSQNREGEAGPNAEDENRNSNTSSNSEVLAQPSTHRMVTRAKDGIFKPKHPFVGLLHSEAETLLSQVTVPKNIAVALQTPHWKEAMEEEFRALQRNNTWILVPPVSSRKVIDCRWVLKTKLKPDGSLLKYKARLVAKGFQQAPGLDYGETFSPVVKPITIRVVLTAAVTLGWEDLGSAYYFLGIEINQSQSGMHLCQSKYVLDILKRFNMLDCAPVPTPMIIGRQYSKNEGEPLKDPTPYRQAIGSLQYLTNTRPDIAFSVNKLSQFLACPTDVHLQGVKRILRYLKGDSLYGCATEERPGSGPTIVCYDVKDKHVGIAERESGAKPGTCIKDGLNKDCHTPTGRKIAGVNSLIGSMASLKHKRCLQVLAEARKWSPQLPSSLHTISILATQIEVEHS
ncbi:Retrovirus-related Pol polyprotein from transposon RE1 [Senna tora]|uniref:Retrovirus-related Pol polyprotein from transposon RE1 n=1 Tax=Senna tora TaxID=362788 RepID=A0A835CFQ1_9FABA|nr:Retrovirus-related Pol polyprotein from transposon RE1 [Senna tora]